MPVYGTRWTIPATNEQTGDQWNVYIKERDYVGANNPLEPGDVPISINYTTTGFFSAEPYWNIASSTCEVSFQDDTTGVLQDILSGDDEQFQIEIDNSTLADIQWTGFVIPDSYTYSLYAPSISRIKATDRINDLKNIAYANSGALYTGRDDLLGIIVDCLTPTGIEIGFATHDMWYPRFDANNLDTTDDVLVNLFADRTVFQNSDADPFSCFDVLEQILMLKGLRLYQAENRWHISQRKRNTFDSSGTDVFTVFLYDKDGLPESTPTENYTAHKEVSVNDDSTSFAIAPTAGGTIPLGTASITYFHNVPTEGLLGNTDFEAALAGSGNDNWVSGGVMPTATRDDGIGGQQGQSLYMDSIYESTTGFTSIPADPIANLSDYVDQTTSGTIVGGSNTTLQLTIDYDMDLNGTVDSAAGRVYMFFELHIGSYKLYQTSAGSGTYLWSTSPGTDQEKLMLEAAPLKSVRTFTINTPALDDGGTPISGAVFVRIWAPTEDKNGGASNTAQVDRVGFDNVTLSVLDEGSEVPTATQISLTYERNVNRSENATPTLLLGDGPDTGYKSRLTATTSTGGSVNSTSDWSYLPSSSDSGFSIHQFWANQMLLEWGVCNRKITASIYTSDTTEGLKPYHYLRFEDPHTTTKYDYTWTSLVWRPCNTKQILNGQFVQYQEVISADEICTVNVKADTALLQSISIAPGLPCLTTTDFNKDFLYIVSVNNGTGGDEDNIIYRFAIPGDVNTVPWQTTTTPWNDWKIWDRAGTNGPRNIRVDEAAGYIFFSDTSNFYLYRMDLDGSNIVSSTVRANAGLALDKVNQEVYVTDNVTNTIRKCAYSDITSPTGIYSKPSDSLVMGALAIDQSATYLVWGESNVGPTTDDKLYRMDISGYTNKTEIADISGVLGGDSMDNLHPQIDEDAGYLFWTTATTIYRIDYPGGVNVTTVATPSNVGCTVDTTRQKLIYADAFGDTYQSNYDGSSEEKILDWPASYDHIAFSTGHS